MTLAVEAVELFRLRLPSSLARSQSRTHTVTSGQLPVIYHEHFRKLLQFTDYCMSWQRMQIMGHLHLLLVIVHPIQ